jgi:hypothetical protein
MQAIDLLCQLVVGEWVGMRSLSVEFLLRELRAALLLVSFAIFLALLAFA